MNYWNKKTVPHKGWINYNVEDLGSAEHKCDMCGQEEVRYVHKMYHPNMDDYFYVGCVCAEKMTNDYVTPKILRKREVKRTHWIEHNWRKLPISQYEEKNVNIYGYRCEVGVFEVNGKFTFHIDNKISNFTFDTMIECKKHIYEYYDLGDVK